MTLCPHPAACSDPAGSGAPALGAAGGRCFPSTWGILPALPGAPKLSAWPWLLRSSSRVLREPRPVLSSPLLSPVLTARGVHAQVGAGAEPPALQSSPAPGRMVLVLGRSRAGEDAPARSPSCSPPFPPITSRFCGTRTVFSAGASLPLPVTALRRLGAEPPSLLLGALPGSLLRASCIFNLKPCSRHRPGSGTPTANESNSVF